MTWITGKEILERPGWGLKAELAKAFKAGLRPFREADEAMLTARVERDGKMVDMGSRCFHCVHGSEDRGYMATGCPRNDAAQNIDIIIKKIVKPGIEELRGKVDKSLFRAGLPSNIFDFPGYSADADFVQYVAEQVGSENLRAMLLESRCRSMEPTDQNEVCNRLLAAQFRLQDVKAFEDLHGIGQAAEGQVEAPVPVQVASELYEEENGLRMRLPTRPGTAWDQIRIRIAKNGRFEIGRPGYDMEAYNTQELGLQKARTKLALLKAFGLRGGELKKDITKDASPANMSNLRKHISGIFPGVEGNPIQMSEDGCYVCQFQICVNEEEFSREYYTSDNISDEGNDWEEIMGARI